MKIKYLGTAAAEGVPGLFCNCEICNRVRELKGPNVRTRSQAIIADDFLIDFPPDTYMHVLQNGLRLDKVKYLLMTHSHSDHFLPSDLALRGMDCAHNMHVENLKMFCNEAVLNRFLKEDVFPAVREHIDITVVKPFHKYCFGDYYVVPLPANHMQTETAFIYIIGDHKKTILYGNDTGIPSDDVFEFIKNSKTKFDLVSLDCTFGFRYVSGGGHLCLDGVAKVRRRLTDIGAMDGNTLLYITHFSHNGRPIQADLEVAAKEFEGNVAYDGLEIEF